MKIMRKKTMASFASAALVLLYLIITLPVAVALQLDASLPKFSKDDEIDIIGKTEPGTNVQVIVNGEAQRAFTAQGKFNVQNVKLPAQTNSVVVIGSKDSEQKQVSQQIVVDRVPPSVTINIPKESNQLPIKVTGTTNEPVTLSVLATIVDDEIPEPISGLKADKEPNIVKLSWKQSRSSDVKAYLIKRDSKLIAVAGASPFEDQPSAGTHDYSVIPIDTACNQGESGSITVQVVGQELPDLVEKTLQEIGCEPTKTDANDDFEIPVSINPEEETRIIVVASDKAGNSVEFRETTIADTSPPRFLQTNLRQLSPSFSPVVKAKGQLTEKSSVTVFVNGDKQETVVTDDNGVFDVKVELQRKIKIKANDSSASIDFREGFANEVKLVAQDKSGQKAEDFAQVDFLLCGTTGDFRIDMQVPSTTVLTPRFLMQQIQEVGIPFNISYTGTREVVFGEKDISLHKILLNEEGDLDYDNDWVTPNAIVRKRGREALGYAQIKFDHVPDLVPEEKKASKNITEFDKEKALSDNRKGQCKLPGFGCAKLLLELEIKASEMSPILRTPGAVDNDLSDVQERDISQKACISLEIQIDKPIPRDKLPKGMLKTVVEIFQIIIDAIDVVLKPLETITTYTLYACGASMVWKFVQAFQTSFACTFSSRLSVFTGNAWDDKIARAGMCEDVFGSDDKQKQACLACQNSVKNQKWFDQTVYKPVCDRVFCPPAPTTQYFIKDAHAQGLLEKINIPGGVSISKKYSALTIAGGPPAYYYGSDCAAYAARLIVSPSSRLIIGTQQMRDVYKQAKHPTPVELKETCKGLHPATPECCGIEYQQEWGTACGLGQSFDTFDELKESTCLAEQRVGKNEISLGSGVASPGCGKVWNALAGFCEPKGGPSSGLVFLGVLENTDPASGVIQPYRPEAYIFVVPKTGQTTRFIRSKQTTVNDFDIFVGYPKSGIELQKLDPAQKALIKGSTARLSATLEGVPITGGDVKSLFSQENVDKHLDGTLEDHVYADLLQIIRSLKINPLFSGREIYSQVVDIIGEPDQQYIVKPESGMLRSAQCLCLPALTSYLQLWKNILGAVKNCFNSLLLTGDGDSELCRAMLDRYICDLIYDVVRCFVQKYSIGGARVRAGGIGNVLGALSEAGKSVSDSVRARYGTTGLYKAMFIDKKLVNAICAFAFTGQWNLDPSALFQTAIDQTPIDSVGLLSPCERRFIAFDPTTKPLGLGTWTYRLGAGLAAGALLRYELDLVSSNGFGCNPADGFVNGECDCNRVQDKGRCTTSIGISGMLQKNEIFQQEVIQTIQSSSPESALRYDKAVLKWTYTDNTNTEVTDQAECKIRHVGPMPPAFCNFDIFTLSFRCEIGEQSSGVKLKSAVAKYKSKLATVEVFGVDERPEFEIGVTQKFPIEPRKQQGAAKKLVYEVRNQNGAVIDELSSQLGVASGKSLDKNGDYTETIVLEKVSKSMFSVGSEQAGKVVTINAFSNRGTSEGEAIAVPTEMWRKAIPIDSVELSSSDQQTQQPLISRSYLLEVSQQRIRAFAHPQKVANAATGFGPPDEAKELYPKGGVLYQQGSVEFTEVEKTGNVNVEIERTLDFVIKNKPLLAKNEKVQVLIDVKNVQPKNVDPCSAASKTTAGVVSQIRPVQWTVMFQAFDEQRAGAMPQLSIDPETGMPAQLIQRFNVVCLEKDLLGVLPPAQEEGYCKEGKVFEPCICDTVSGQKINCGIDNKNFCHYSADKRNAVCSDKPACEYSMSQKDKVGKECLCLPKDRSTIKDSLAVTGKYCCLDGKIHDGFVAGCAGVDLQIGKTEGPLIAEVAKAEIESNGKSVVVKLNVKLNTISSETKGQYDFITPSKKVVIAPVNINFVDAGVQQLTLTVSDDGFIPSQIEEFKLTAVKGDISQVFNFRLKING